MWVDYWGAKGYVGPPLKLLGDLPPLPPPSYAYVKVLHNKNRETRKVQSNTPNETVFRKPYKIFRFAIRHIFSWRGCSVTFKESSPQFSNIIPIFFDTCLNRFSLDINSPYLVFVIDNLECSSCNEDQLRCFMPETSYMQWKYGGG